MFFASTYGPKYRVGAFFVCKEANYRCARDFSFLISPSCVCLGRFFYISQAPIKRVLFFLLFQNFPFLSIYLLCVCFIFSDVNRLTLSLPGLSMLSSTSSPEP